jgi:hypothetical protein
VDRPGNDSDDLREVRRTFDRLREIIVVSHVCADWFDASNRNPLDLVERNFIPGAVIKLGGARAFVRRHRLGVFQRAAGSGYRPCGSLKPSPSQARPRCVRGPGSQLHSKASKSARCAAMSPRFIGPFKTELAAQDHVAGIVAAEERQKKEAEAVRLAANAVKECVTELGPHEF